MDLRQVTRRRCGLVDFRRWVSGRWIVVAVAGASLFLLGAASPASAGTQTKTIAVETHLNAKTDPSSFTPGCNLLLLDLSGCDRVYYSGRGKYSGDLVGDVDYSGYGYLREDGRLAAHEPSNFFRGTAAGCGYGTFSYRADPVFYLERGGVTGDEPIEIIPGSGTEDLKGLTGRADGIFVLLPDGSLSVDYVGTFTCRRSVLAASR